MKTLSPNLARVSAAILVFVALGAARPAFADLYKYETPDGEILISTQKRSGLKLIEVISDAKPSRAKQSVHHRARRAHTKARARAKARSGSPIVDRQHAFDDIIREASRAYDVPFAFVKAVIRIESNFNPNAVSVTGAQGLMQLMPKTAASLNVTDPFNPRQNIFGGTKFLRILIDRYQGDINLILAAYNAGDAAVARYDGIPYPQTRGYVASVFRWYQVYSADEKKR